MDYNYIMGSSGGSMMLFSWFTYILVIILLVLDIATLWKYINKKL